MIRTYPPWHFICTLLSYFSICTCNRIASTVVCEAPPCAPLCHYLLQEATPQQRVALQSRTLLDCPLDTLRRSESLQFSTMSRSNCYFFLSIMARTRLRKTVPPHTRISAIRQQSRPQLSSVAPCEKRQFSRVTWLGYPRKDSQDRESINTEAIEYSKSGTDDEAARHEEAAFDPNTTDPEAQKKKAGEVG